MIVDVFFPCIHDGFSEQQRENLLKILSQVGDQPSDVAAPQCCGQHFYLSGYPQLAKTYGEHLLKAYEANRPLIVASTSCLGYMKHYYNKFFFNTSLHNELKQFQNNVLDITQYLVSVKKKTAFGARFEGVVAYYKPCVASEKCNMSNEAELLLKEVEGLRLVDYHAQNCCGAGGHFPVSYPDFAEKLALMEIQEMMDQGAEYIVSSDARCLNHFKSVIEKNKFSIKTIHIVDVLASGY